MHKNHERFTKSKARLRFIKENKSSKNFAWIFLPGGPGLGSESLSDLTQMLELPGTTWHLDLPDDGSNVPVDNDRKFENWQAALIEACSLFQNTILVAHSTGGMFALSTPELKHKLVGLILISSAPDASWQTAFAAHLNSFPMDAAQNELHAAYQRNPSNALLKEISIAGAKFCAMPENISTLTELMKGLHINYRSCLWAENHFDKTYSAKWIPDNLPTLIITGELDKVTPLHLFIDAPTFSKSQIVIQPIVNAAHFPWLDNPQQIKTCFKNYYNNLLK